MAGGTKITVEIPAALWEEAKAQARARHMTLREFVEEGLRLALGRVQPSAESFHLGDGSQDLGVLLIENSWPTIRQVIYEGRGE